MENLPTEKDVVSRPWKTAVPIDQDYTAPEGSYWKIATQILPVRLDISKSHFAEGAGNRAAGAGLVE